MQRTFATKVLSTSLCFLLVILAGPFGAEVPLSAQEPAPAYSGQGTPLTAAELQGLAAPIALYPDALIAQILGGSTFPDQIASAGMWLEQNQSLTGQAFLQAVNAQSWEPSVKALTQFPTVLKDMAKNLSWTSALGEAYATQAADVMTAVQVLRAKAKAAGNLKSGSQITVVQESPQVIVIQPVNPQVIYVPAYNPAVVYGYPYVVPGYSTAAVVTTGVIAFGVGIAVGMAISGGYGWAGIHGTAAGTAARSSITAELTTETLPGTAVATMALTGMAATAVLPRATIPRREPLRVVEPYRTATGRSAEARRTTQEPEPQPRPCKAPTPTAAMAPRRLPKTAPR
jgi:hypothetical protein